MLKYAGYDIVFQEIPDEVTLALNLSGCPNGCPGCHSPHLQRDEGEALTPGALERLLERYGREITCVCFMGGDATPGRSRRVGAAHRAYDRGHDPHRLVLGPAGAAAGVRPGSRSTMSSSVPTGRSSAA